MVTGVVDVYEARVYTFIYREKRGKKGKVKTEVQHEEGEGGKGRRISRLMQR